MNKKITNSLIQNVKKLKNKYKIFGLKTEFEAEGSTIEEAIFIQKICNKFNLNHKIKIGGAEAKNVYIQSIRIGSQYVVAPMVETGFAALKFINMTNEIKNPKSLNLEINIETINSVKEIDKILKISKSKVTGYTIGRTDLANSFFNKKIKPNSKKIFSLINYLIKKIKKSSKKKKITIGGSVDKKTFEILNQNKSLLKKINKIETRKVIFNINDFSKNLSALEDALEFEKIFNTYMFLKTENPRFKKRIVQLNKRT